MTRAAPNPTVATRQSYGALFLATLAACLLASAPAWGDDAYSYVRTIEGYASLETADEGTLDAVENQPLIPGDILIVGTSGRVELVLADGSVLRMGGPGELRFESLARTADTLDAGTRLLLIEGELQLVLDTAVDGPVELATSNASLFLESPGEYRVTASGSDRTSVDVRDGFAEAQTDRGSAILRAGEAGFIDGSEWASLEVAPAQRRSTLEAWGDELDAEARLANTPYVEPQLQYRAARMASYGTWVEVGDRWGWRPYVDADWRPYVHGVWRYTPSGLTWVSNEPWGWVPSHYGSWDLVPGYGWTWFAGSYYTPASVYWYWGPTHVAWVPAGYYTSFYSSHRYTQPRLGVYGWAGGDWGFFAEWTFCPTRYFGRGRYDHYFRSGYEVGRHASYSEVPRGVIATDTRSLRRDVWGDPERIATRLVAADSRLSPGSLPDVTDFVARRKDVRPEIAEIVRPQEVATLRSRTRSTSSELRERSQVVGRGRDTRVGRPSFERGETRGDARPEARSLRADERPRSVQEEPRKMLDRGAYGRPEFQSRDRGREIVRSESQRGDLERGQVIRRGIPTTEQDEDPRLQFGRGRPSEGSESPSAAAGDDRAVVRRVIEQMRSRREAPPTATSTRESTKPPEASGRRSSQSPSRQAAPSSSSSSRVRDSRGDSRSSARGRSSSTKPPQRQSARSRSSSRKPPGA